MDSNFSSDIINCTWQFVKFTIYYDEEVAAHPSALP